MHTKTESGNSKTRVGQLISQAMSEQGLSIKDLADKIETTYEHVRRVVKGEGNAGKPVLKLICQTLKIPYNKAERLAAADKIEKKYGDIPRELSGKVPGLGPIERVWEQLTEDDQKVAIDVVTAMAKRSKRV